VPRTLLSLACLAVLAPVLAWDAAPASAGGLPPPASKLEPPRYIDETLTELFLLNRVGGYVFTIRSTVRGPTSDSDALRIDLVQKGKTIASQRCPLGSTLRKTGLPFQCDYEGKPLKATLNLDNLGNSDASGQVKFDVFALANGQETFVGTVTRKVGVKAGKAKKLSYASVGNGASSHIIGEFITRQFKLDAVHVPYKGGTPAITDLMGGQVDFMAATYGSVANLAK
jgi:hypothetical protein